MGAFLEKPKVDKFVEGGEGNGLRYALASMQGWRTEMEDAHTAVAALPAKGLFQWSFFAVFDGHAGAGVSAHCAEKLLDSIINNSEFPLARRRDDIEDNQNGDAGRDEDGDLACMKRQAALTAGSDQEVEEVTKGIRSGFLALDEQLRQLPDMRSGKDKSGSTAVCCLVSPTHMYFANCGDSRAVLCRGGSVCLSTQDHKPANPAERERIQAAGGSVMIQRVNGSLAVSRALGDYDYKQVAGKGQCEQLVSPEPEITVLPRFDDRDEFVVLACDGVWDVMTNQEVCQLVGHELRVGTPLPDICSIVIDVSLHRGSRDNMSVILVALPGCPKVVDEMRATDQQLRNTIETRVVDVLKQDISLDLDSVVKILETDDSLEDYLPPGGGILARRSWIETVYYRVKPNPSAGESAQIENSKTAAST